MKNLKSIVPYTKEIVFANKIVEICSISLEHELHYSDTEIEGNFLVSGEYRSHEVSINKEPFHYKLPFSLEVTDTVVKDSIDFEITDFTYEVEQENTLVVHIEFMVTAEEEEPKEEIEEEISNEVLEEEPEQKEEQEEVREAVIEEISNMFSLEEELEENSDVEEKRLDEESEALILDSAKETDDEFATYHIHIVGSEDTLEGICAMYQTDSNILKAYNNVESISVGDKIIIPCIDE